MKPKADTTPEDPRSKRAMRPPAVSAPSVLSVEILQHPVPKLPHEADQSTTNQQTEIRPEMLQAERDLEAGMQDTGRSPVVNEVYRRQKK
jgi:hypothetical protein